MPLSTANWHWKNKTVTPWAKTWFERELVTVEVGGKEGEKVGVEKVVEVEGDVELGRRKSKWVFRFRFSCGFGFGLCDWTDEMSVRPPVFFVVLVI